MLGGDAPKCGSFVGEVGNDDISRCCVVLDVVWEFVERKVCRVGAACLWRGWWVSVRLLLASALGVLLACGLLPGLLWVFRVDSATRTLIVCRSRH
mmetsp:Transcript_70241/g.114068  ORF Transcript_70241/g.114068 Transcript_70241/m.114068 type:complete len:96 (+) Transcript_70241:795-1082(+)